MAFGFIKKVFSFGKKEVEEVPAQDAAPAPEPAAVPPPPSEPPLPAPPQEPQVEGPVPDFLRRPDEEPEPAASAPAEELPAPHPVPEVPIEVPQPVPADLPDEPDLPEPATSPTPDAEPVLPVEPAPVGEPRDLPEAAEEPGEPQAAPLPVEPAPRPEPAIEPEDAPVSGPVPEFLKEERSEDPPEARSEPEPDPVPVAMPVAPPLPAERVTVSTSVERPSEEAAPAPAPEAPRVSWYDRLRTGLSRSSRELGSSISGIFTRRKLDEDTLQDLEDVLIRADLGVETAMRVTDTLSSGRYGKEVTGAEVRAIMAAEVEKVLTPVAMPLELDLSHKPHVILVVGVNGTGKTTTIGKLAAKLTAGGLKVTLAAGDTFRAAAIEQLKIWGERTGSPVVASKLGADAAGLAYEGFETARRNGSDVLIIDTAGRLQNKAELMGELEKIVRVLGKHDPEAPHTILQTVDATTGQNALNQVEIFRNVAGVNGIVMTKLDGSARGGILVAIAAKHRLPVYFIGVGEGVDDLEPFSAKDFARAIAGVE